MKKRIIAALAVGIAAALMLSACNRGGSASGGGSGQPYIAIVSKGFSQTYWQAVDKGAKAEAKKEGARITFVGPDTESDVEQQIEQLTNALAKNPDAIGFAALDSRASAPLMQQIKSRKIPLIAFDSGVDSTVPLTTVATDNKAAAAAAAKHMAQLVHYQGTVGLVIHDQTSQTGIDRRDGFVGWMKKNAPKIKLLAPQYSNSDIQKADDITKSILAAHRNISGIYGSNEASAEGVAKGLQEAGRKGVVAVGFDSGKAQTNAIRSGLLAGSITQDPVTIGKDVVADAMKAIKGQKLPKNTKTPYYWYDKSNIDDPKIAACLYK